MMMLSRTIVAGLALMLASQLSTVTPMRVVLLVDTGTATSVAIAQIRAAVSTFVDALPADAEVALVTTGGSTRLRVPPTIDRKRLKDSIKGVLTDNGPTVLMDALIETDHRYMMNAPGQRPVFVIITGNGSDGSTHTDDSAFNHWISEIAERGVSVNAIELKTSRFGLPDVIAKQGLSNEATLTTAGNGLPEIVATTLVKATGGHYAVMSNGNALSEMMRHLAEQLIDENPTT